MMLYSCFFVLKMINMGRSEVEKRGFGVFLLSCSRLRMVSSTSCFCGLAKWQLSQIVIARLQK